MTKNKYTNEEIRILNLNPNVKLVKYGRQIEYKEEFKRWAVWKSIYYPELSANQIFGLAGFDINMIGNRIADSRIRTWKSKYAKFIKKDKESINKSAYDLVKENNKMLFVILTKFNDLINILSDRK